MSKKQAALGAAAVAALAAATAVATPTTAGVFSSDREPPRIMLDPAADNTDVYALTGQDGPGKVTAAANWSPLAEPAGGPYFSKLDPASVTSAPGGSKSFVGPADDPFFVDLGAIFDGVNIDKPGRP